MIKNKWPNCKHCKKLSYFKDKKGGLYFCCDESKEVIAETDVNNFGIDIFPVECPRAAKANKEQPSTDMER